MKIKLVVLLFVSSLVFVNCKDRNAQEVKTIQLISVAEMEEALKADDVQLVDVRTEREYKKGHLDNAKNIVYQGANWNEQVASLDKDKPVYVYCAKGGRSAKCAALLEEAGFKKIFDLDGGITQWVNEGKKVE
jgi:rhodanese-related sulfurtransferase